MEDSENSLLLCNESCLEELHHYKDESLNFCSVSESDSEYIEMLIQKEIGLHSNGSSFADKGEISWWKCARKDAIKWILDTRALFGFHFRTAYLSLIYFDRFFSRMSIDNGKLWAIRLISVASLSLAAKIEECEVPLLSEYHVDECTFGGNVIQRMELLILNTLEWKMSFATPFTYLNYFITKFCGGLSHKEVKNRAMGFILAFVREINVMEHQPSIIAATAVLAACDHHLTKKLVEIKIDLVPSWGSLEKDHILFCYNLLQEIEVLKSEVSPKLPSTPSGSIDVVLDDSTMRSSVGSKRRLTFTDGDQHCPQSKIPKL